jgi:uncharacterized membrane protein YfcA
MEFVMGGLTEPVFWVAVAVTLFAGFVKGAVGFAMPMIMISAFSSFLSPELALSGLILPTLVTNFSQAFRQGPAAFWDSVCKYWRFLAATVAFIAVSAQFVRDIPQPVFLALLGVPITGYALLQLLGRNLAIKLEHQTRAEWGLGIVAGLYGGVSGVWGPPLIVYLMSVGVEKVEMLRVQGVIFLLGSVMLLSAHLNSGVLTASSTAFSAVLVIPAVLGMALGMQLGNRLDQTLFRRCTQVLLVVAGLNLMRRALGL